MFLYSCTVWLLWLSRGTHGIYKGFEADFQYWSFIASVQINGYHECGGSVIDTRIILTAAQCVRGIPVAKIAVQLGVTNLRGGGKIIPVTALVVHDQYHELENDIALLWVKSPAIFGRVSKIAVADKEPMEDDYASNAGWGELDLENYDSPKLLYHGMAKVRNRTFCLEELAEPVSDNLICTFYDNFDICPGDYGGPLIFSQRLIGIAVQGHGCGWTYLPALYTNVAKYQDWIKQNSEKLKKNK